MTNLYLHGLARHGMRLSILVLAFFIVSSLSFCGTPDKESARFQIASGYKTIADALRRKDYPAVYKVADAAYGTVGPGGRVLPFKLAIPLWRRRLKDVVRTACRFQIESLDLRGEVAYVVAIESGRQYRTVKGSKVWENTWAPRHDIWRRESKRWRLVRTDYPQGYDTYPDAAPRKVSGK